jgi:hypothetical protein
MCGRVWLPSDFSEIKIRMKFDDQFAAPNMQGNRVKDLVTKG